jgi:hypothetical protein
MLTGISIRLTPDRQRSNNMEQIIERISRFFVAVDNRDWDEVKKILAPEVLLDYTSMSGGEPARLTSTQIVDTWKGFLPGFDATHHQLGNFLVESSGDKATAFFYGTATHYIKDNRKGNLWTVVGSYNINLARTDGAWRIETLKFNLKYIDGNNDLPGLAQERAKK